MSEGGVEKRLSAILAADVAGYTRRMEEDADGTVAAWQSALADVVEPAIENHSGRIVKHTGDGFLVEFSTVQNAVQCAIDMQRGLAASRLDFRMGVSIGDIIDDGHDIHGEGVNIAARIEALAEPGGISISGMVHEAVRNQIDAHYEDTGEQTVKNVSNPVRVYRVLLADAETTTQTPSAKTGKMRQRLIAAAAVVVMLAAGLGWYSTRPDFDPVDPATMTLKLPERPSIAVLPFDYFGEGKAENEYIADGLSEQITSVLADVPELFVIARNSSFTYKGKAVDVRDVSKNFGVRYVLEGSVQKSGDKLRVTAQLIDAVDGKHIWAETFDRAYTDLFKIQDEITVAVAQKIHLGTIRGNELANRPTNNLEAWSENVKGLEQLRLFTAEGYENARQHFARAIELDPQYVNPHHLMAFAHVNDVRFGYSADPAESFSLAEQFLSKALALEPGNVEALAGTAFLRYVQKNIPEAKKLALEAHEKAPNQPYVAFALAWILLYSGDPEGAIPYYSLIKRLAPVTSVAILNGDLLAHIYAGKYEEARKLVPAYLERVPEILQPVNLVLSALPYYKLNDVAKAKSMVAKALQLQPNLSIKSFRHYDLPFVDQSVPESFYAVYRELGVPDLPPGMRADPAKMALKLPEKPSIAVLPFDYFGEGKAENEYIADGLSEHITSVLADIPGLFVIARKSSFTYKDKAVDVREVSERFGVRYVLEGSVQKSGDKLRVTAQLIDAIAGTHIWAKSYDREFDDLFQIQDEITLSVARKTYGKAVEGDFKLTKLTKSLVAWSEAVKGRTLLRKYTEEALEQARRHFTNAIEADPAYALPRSLLALGLALEVRFGYAPDPRKTLAMAEQHVLKVLEMNSSGAGSMTTLAFLRYIQKRVPKAKELAHKAYKQSPNHPYVAQSYAWILKHGGESKAAIPIFARVKRLQPVVTRDLLYDEYTAHLDAGLFEEARTLAPAMMAAAIDRLRARTTALAAVSYLRTSDKAKADALISQALAHDPDLSMKNFRWMAQPYVDKSLPERTFAALRELGVPDLPPGMRADPAKMKYKLPEKPSIAVLPFANLSDDKDQEYFADGMADDLITDLSHVSGLLVIARNSSFSYKGRNVKVQEIAADLGVRYVLEGSVRRAEGQIRINAQLIDTTSGSHLWANTFDRPFKDVFALQDEVTAKIVAALKVKLTPGETKQLGARDTASLEAYEAYLKGWEISRTLTPTAYAKALPLLKKAVELDTDYNRAHAALASLYWEGGYQRGWYHALVVDNADHAYQKTIIHLDAVKTPTPIAHIVQAELLSSFLYDNDAAVAEARRAVELDPNFADGYFALAQQLASAGSTEDAIAMADRGARLDPLQVTLYRVTRGYAHYVAGRYEPALKEYTEATRLSSSDIWAWTFLAAIQGHLGDTPAASKSLAILQAERQRVGRSDLRAGFALTMPIKNPLVKKRLFEDLKAAGVPVASAKLDEGEVFRQLNEAEIRNLLVGKKIQGIIVTKAEQANVLTFTYTLDKDLKGVFRTSGADYITHNQFEGDAACNARGCTRFFKLTDAGARRWNATHVMQEDTGILYYFRSVSPAN